MAIKRVNVLVYSGMTTTICFINANLSELYFQATEVQWSPFAIVCTAFVVCSLQIMR